VMFGCRVLAGLEARGSSFRPWLEAFANNQ
jgi:hypothetical protein